MLFPHKAPYNLLSKYVNPFNPNTDYKEICQLGMSAASVGKIREAVTFLKIVRMKAAAADTEYIEKIEKNYHLTESREQNRIRSYSTLEVKGDESRKRQESQDGSV